MVSAISALASVLFTEFMVVLLSVFTEFMAYQWQFNDLCLIIYVCSGISVPFELLVFVH